MEIKGIPLDAPLFEADPERGAEYWNCESLTAFFTLKGPIAALLPSGLVPAADPPLAGVTIANYGRSTAGPYLEEISMIQVKTETGEVGVYVPYVYVTTDVAMAGGREALGFPKKLAGIEMARWSDIVMGIVERPIGNRLITLTMKPDDRLDAGLQAVLAPVSTKTYTVRHVPGRDGRGELTQLVESIAEMYNHKDARGNEIVFTGPTTLTYNSPTIIDPVHNLEVGQMVAGVYREYDAVLKFSSVLRESFTPTLVTAAVR